MTINTALMNGGRLDLTIVKGQDFSMPLQVLAAIPIQSSTNATPIQITTQQPHGLSTGNSVVITGHNVNLPANSTWTVTVVDAYNITLNGSTATANMYGGGATGYVGQPVNITGYTIEGDVSDSPGELANVILPLTCTVTSAVNGQFTISLTNSQTAAPQVQGEGVFSEPHLIDFGYYDVWAIGTTNFRIVYGDISFVANASNVQ